MNAMEQAKYDDAIDFAARGIMVFDLLKPRARAQVVERLRRAIELRGGLVDGGRRMHQDIARDVLAEVLERGCRHYATELGQRLPGLVDEDVVLKVEEQVSDVLHRGLKLLELEL